jgi:hypothetical protein
VAFADDGIQNCAVGGKFRKVGFFFISDIRPLIFDVRNHQEHEGEEMAP